MFSNLENAGSLNTKQILLGKLSRAILTSVFSQVLLLFIYLCFLNLNIFKPTEWIKIPFNVLISFSTWLYIIPFAGIVFAQGIICAKDYIISSKYYSTRFQTFWSVFSLHNLLLLVLHVLIGGVWVWLFLSLSNTQYNSLFESCKERRYCLNENTFYLIISGLWSGLYFCVSVHTAEKDIMFPVIQQKKLIQFKAYFVALLRKSFSKAIMPSIYYNILFFILKHYIQQVFNFTTHPVNGSYFVYFYVYVFAGLINFHMNLMTFFYELYLTEKICFPIMKDYEETTTLSEALSMNIPILEHLAAFDFFTMSATYSERRAILFTLSQPGGHPHNWNNLLNVVINKINNYSDNLSKATSEFLGTEKITKLANAQIQQQEQIPVLTANFTKLRNMAFHSNTFEITNVQSSSNPSLDLSTSIENALNRFGTRVKDIIQYLKTVSGYNFIFGDLPEASIQKSLANGQVIMWSIQGLSSLTITSLQEDKYGIVQKDIVMIINTLLNLKMSIDKLNRIPALITRGPGLDDYNLKMKNSIMSAVKRSLHNISLMFAPYIRDLGLQRDVLTQLLSIVKVDKCRQINLHS